MDKRQLIVLWYWVVDTHYLLINIGAPKSHRLNCASLSYQYSSLHYEYSFVDLDRWVPTEHISRSLTTNKVTP